MDLQERKVRQLHVLRKKLFKMKEKAFEKKLDANALALLSIAEELHHMLTQDYRR